MMVPSAKNRSATSIGPSSVSTTYGWTSACKQVPGRIRVRTTDAHRGFPGRERTPPQTRWCDTQLLLLMLLDSVVSRLDNGDGFPPMTTTSLGFLSYRASRWYPIPETYQAEEKQGDIRLGRVSATSGPTDSTVEQMKAGGDSWCGNHCCIPSSLFRCYSLYLDRNVRRLESDGGMMTD